MTKIVQQGGQSSWGIRYPVVVNNGSSELAPAYAVLQIYSAPIVGDSEIYGVTKPTGAVNVKYLINSPGALAIGLPGAATDRYPTNVLISGSPSLYQEVGPVAGSWAMSVNGQGYLYIGGLANGVGKVAAKSGSSAGDDFPLVKIVNNTGTFKPAGTVVGYGSLVDAWPSKPRVPTFNSTEPTAGKPFAILLTDVNFGDVCDAAPVGTAWVQVNVTDAAHEYAEAVTNDYTQLKSATSGQARILRREKEQISGGAGLGLQAARVRLDPFQTDDLRGRVYATLQAATVDAGTGVVTPGVGQCKLNKIPAAGSVSGTPWQADDNPVLAENWSKSSIPADTNVLLRYSRKDGSGNSIYVAYPDSTGSDGGSGVFVCTLAGPISPGSLVSMGLGTGTVYSISAATLTSVGARTLYNPFKISLPSSSASDLIQYTCEKTTLHALGQPDSDDKFTITGIDPQHLLASLGGFGAGKVFYTSGGSVTDQKWGGKTC